MRLKTTQKTYEAGDNIIIDFERDTTLAAQLFLKSSYGSTMITSSTGEFVVPDYFSRKKGRLDYYLVQEGECLYQGVIDIEAKSKTKIQLETYVGPPSIVAGGEDYTMHVVVPSDIYDNPIADSTKIWLKHQFLGLEKEYEEVTKDLISWKNIFSYSKKGKLLISSQIAEIHSKEFTVEIYPSLAQNFKIYSFREHEYADGNQVTTFTSDVIKDSFGNIVSDGTMVNFVIKNSEGSLLTTQGTTVNGIVTAKLLHPDHADSWEISAFIDGIAESEILEITFDGVLDDFEVSFDMYQREIVVGPLTSFMGQIIPDGAIVKLEIYTNNELIETKVKTSFEGRVKFVLEEGFYPDGEYDFRIKSMGIAKWFKNRVLQ
ncbi:Ig-like domain-containing protein [Aquimarina sp. D1M17]|uniref:Ig-like domain-containing protein n=1 Tax=Aquimarina acroporae TaxID=2937283 RepID=UPI0020BF612A|nr:Ig-like domain-containing protein [Aquimarina acroporae]MCK8521331.1 Ig-like domain-containing protein [Aquimarina acroporae]